MRITCPACGLDCCVVTAVRAEVDRIVADALRHATRAAAAYRPAATEEPT